MHEDERVRDLEDLGTSQFKVAWQGWRPKSQDKRGIFSVDLN
jgi:hypothetical protein